VGVVAPAPDWDRHTFRKPLDGKPAVTHARVAGRAPDGGAAWVSFMLETGRTRQIRRHAAAGGYPLVGDRDAGGAPAARLLLHARALELAWRGERIRAEAAVPEEMSAAARALGLLPGCEVPD